MSRGKIKQKRRKKTESERISKRKPTPRRYADPFAGLGLALGLAAVSRLGRAQIKDPPPALNLETEIND